VYKDKWSDEETEEKFRALLKQQLCKWHFQRLWWKGEPKVILHWDRDPGVRHVYAMRVWESKKADTNPQYKAHYESCLSGSLDFFHKDCLPKYRDTSTKSFSKKYAHI